VTVNKMLGKARFMNVKLVPNYVDLTHPSLIYLMDLRANASDCSPLSSDLFAILFVFFIIFESLAFLTLGS